MLKTKTIGILYLKNKIKNIPQFIILSTSALNFQHLNDCGTKKWKNVESIGLPKINCASLKQQCCRHRLRELEMQ